MLSQPASRVRDTLVFQQKELLNAEQGAQRPGRAFEIWGTGGGREPLGAGRSGSSLGRRHKHVMVSMDVSSTPHCTRVMFQSWRLTPLILQ